MLDEIQNSEVRFSVNENERELEANRVVGTATVGKAETTDEFTGLNSRFKKSVGGGVAVPSLPLQTQHPQDDDAGHSGRTA